MGRRKIKMERVKDPASRLVTFSKRRNGLFKKANELAILCGVEVAIVVFSPGGKPFSFGHPSVNNVTQRFFRQLQGEDVDEDEEEEEEEEAKSAAGGSSSAKKASRKAEKLNKRLMNLMKELEEEKKKGAMLDKEIEEKKKEYGLGPESGPDDLSKLEGLKRSLEKLREDVKLHKREMEAASSLLVLAEKLQLKEEEDNDVADDGSDDDGVASASDDDDGGEIRNVK